MNAAGGNSTLQGFQKSGKLLAGRWEGAQWREGKAGNLGRPRQVSTQGWDLENVVVQEV